MRWVAATAALTLALAAAPLAVKAQADPVAPAVPEGAPGGAPTVPGLPMPPLFGAAPAMIAPVAPPTDPNAAGQPNRDAPAGDAATAPERAAPAPAGPVDLGAALASPDYDARTRLELEILQRVNGVRAERGLAALALDDRLVAAAREHAVDMAYHNFCRHTGSDGTRSRDRLRRNGYPFNNWAGENILCARRTADAALNWWMRSAPHRANILHPHFSHIGVGVSMLGTYGPDMVLTFAAGDANTAEPGAFKALREGTVATWIASTREPEQRPR